MAQNNARSCDHVVDDLVDEKADQEDNEEGLCLFAKLGVELFEPGVGRVGVFRFVLVLAVLFNEGHILQLDALLVANLLSDLPVSEVVVEVVLDDFRLLFGCVLGLAAEADGTLIVELLFGLALRFLRVAFVLALNLFLDPPARLHPSFAALGLSVAELLGLPADCGVLPDCHTFQLLPLVAWEVLLDRSHGAAGGMRNLICLLVLPVDFDVNRRGELAVAAPVNWLSQLSFPLPPFFLSLLPALPGMLLH